MLAYLKLYLTFQVVPRVSPGHEIDMRNIERHVPETILGDGSDNGVVSGRLAGLQC